MKVKVRQSPSFAVGRCGLAPEEQIRVEPGAMVAHSPGMELSVKAEGGLRKALRRKLSGESFFMSTFTAPANGGWVDVAHHLPGDVVVLDVDITKSWLLERGAWLASDSEVAIDTKWDTKMALGGEGGFMVRVSGGGKVIAATYGAAEGFDLGAGQSVVVDSGHVLAFTDTVTYELKRAVEGRTIQSMKSGEGLVFHMTGPGRIYVQTRNKKGLASWLTGELPFARRSHRH